MNRRGFIGSILGAVAWSESKFGVPLYPVIGNDGKLHGYSPAVSAIQPTCETSRWNWNCVVDQAMLACGDAVWVNNANFFQEGQLIDVYGSTESFRGTAMVSSVHVPKNIIHLSGNVLAGPCDMLVVHGADMGIVRA